MLPLDDPRWKNYKGGYRHLYDASVPLKKLLEHGASKEIWEELWQELHHQGDIDAASYAAVPYLLEFARLSPKLDWNVFGLISTIEMERPSNPPPPAEIANDYFRAIEALPEIVGSHSDHEWDDILTQCILSCIALARGQRVLARVYAEMSLDWTAPLLPDSRSSKLGRYNDLICRREENPCPDESIPASSS